MLCERCQKEYPNNQLGIVKDKNGNPHRICVDCYNELKESANRQIKEPVIPQTEKQIVANSATVSVNEVVCPVCQYKREASLPFCPKCGASVNGLSTSTTVTAEMSLKKWKKGVAVAAIILLVGILTVVGIFVLKDKEVINAAAPTETIELNAQNFTEYFDVDITVGTTSCDGETEDFLLGWTKYDLSADITITIKSKVPLMCENVYVSIDSQCNKKSNEYDPVNDDKVINAKLDESGYYTKTQKVHIKNSYFKQSIFQVDGDEEITEASGTITFNPDRLAEYKASVTTEAE